MILTIVNHWLALINSRLFWIILILIIKAELYYPFFFDELPEVTTVEGRIQGVRMYNHHHRSFYAFRGIPYAQAPIGFLRFKVILFDLLISLYPNF